MHVFAVLFGTSNTLLHLWLAGASPTAQKMLRSLLILSPV
jgi:hypothetical protein